MILKRRDKQDSVVGAFVRGFREWNSFFGITYDDDPTSPRSVAYDRGRNLAYKLRGYR